MVLIDYEGGLFLKHAADSLEREATMTRFFHERGLAPEVIDYRSDESGDWLLTRRAAGADCTDARYMDNPERLCDTLAELLRTLHDQPVQGCPAPDRTAEYLENARCGFSEGRFDPSFYETDYGAASPAELHAFLQARSPILEQNVLLHGDYCLPNIVLNEWRFSAFIDLGCAGVGDRHVDVFWALWTLRFNLKTDAYRARFIRAYGKDLIDDERLRLVAAAECFA